MDYDPVKVRSCCESTLKILGIDPGTRVVGYGVVASRGPQDLQYIECGVLKSNRSLAHERVYEIATELRELIAEVKPHELAIESAFHGLNAYSALALGESRGAYKLVAAECGLPVFEYAPARIKRAVTGSGRAQKSWVQRSVSARCGLAQVPAHDAADALAIAICHAQLREPIEALQSGRR